jgi:molybdopterin/thiamine biosynthesis adenylyltransferase
MRYSRQEIYIGKKSQEILRKKTVAIVGCGALGSTSASLLARAGIGKLILIDRDVVEVSNLQRQLLFEERDIGQPKALMAKAHLERINSEVKIVAFVKNLDHTNVDLLRSDLILDCTDNFETRFLINEYCTKNSLRWIYASVLKDVGYVLNFLPGKPCFHCVFKETGKLETTATAGILNTIISAISGIQVTEAFKILLDRQPTEELIRFNVWDLELEKIKVKKNFSCPVCEKKTYEFLQGLRGKAVVRLAASNNFQITGKPINIYELEEKLKKIDKVENKHNCLHFQDMVIFRDGRVLIKADSEEEAKSLYHMYIESPDEL